MMINRGYLQDVMFDVPDIGNCSCASDRNFSSLSRLDRSYSSIPRLGAGESPFASDLKRISFSRYVKRRVFCKGKCSCAVNRNFSQFSRSDGNSSLISRLSAPQKLQMQANMLNADLGVGGSPFASDLKRISFSGCCMKSRVVCKASSVRERSAEDVCDGANFYEILGLSQDVALPDIKAAYRQMARRYHPDVCPPEEAEENTRRFIAVQEAYETLSDPRRKALYDTAMTKPSLYSSRAWSRDIEEDQLKWKERWEDQLATLKRRSAAKAQQDVSESWGARMRRQRQYQQQQHE